MDKSREATVNGWFSRKQQEKKRNKASFVQFRPLYDMCKYIIMSSKSNLCCLCYHIDIKLPSAIPLPQEVATCSYTGSIWQVGFYALPDVTPSLAGIDPATFRLPSKCFNHYTRV